MKNKHLAKSHARILFLKDKNRRRKLWVRNDQLGDIREEGQIIDVNDFSEDKSLAPDGPADSKMSLMMRLTSNHLFQMTWTRSGLFRRS